MSEFQENLKRNRRALVAQLADMMLLAMTTPEEVQARAAALAEKSVELNSSAERLAQVLRGSDGKLSSVNLGMLEERWQYSAHPTTDDGLLMGFAFAARRLDGDDDPLEVQDVFFTLGGASDDRSATELVIRDGEATWRHAYDDTIEVAPDLGVIRVAEACYQDIEQALAEVWSAAGNATLNPELAARISQQ